MYGAVVDRAAGWYQPCLFAIAGQPRSRHAWHRYRQPVVEQRACRLDWIRRRSGGGSGVSHLRRRASPAHRAWLSSSSVASTTKSSAGTKGPNRCLTRPGLPFRPRARVAAIVAFPTRPTIRTLPRNGLGGRFMAACPLDDRYCAQDAVVRRRWDIPRFSLASAPAFLTGAIDATWSFGIAGGAEDVFAFGLIDDSLFPAAAREAGRAVRRRGSRHRVGHPRGDRRQPGLASTASLACSKLGGIMNAFILLDNMDGLRVSPPGALFFAVDAALIHSTTCCSPRSALVLASAVAGFLPTTSGCGRRRLHGRFRAPGDRAGCHARPADELAAVGVDDRDADHPAAQPRSPSSTPRSQLPSGSLKDGPSTRRPRPRAAPARAQRHLGEGHRRPRWRSLLVSPDEPAIPFQDNGGGRLPACS